MSIEFLTANPLRGAMRPYVPGGTKIAISVDTKARLLGATVVVFALYIS